MITVYGIKNCDTIRKTRRWFELHNIAYTFHDYRSDGLDQGWLAARIEQLGWKTLVNQRGTTYRQLSAAEKNAFNDHTALAALIKAPAMIKRPLVVVADPAGTEQTLVGFQEPAYRAKFL